MITEEEINDLQLLVNKTDKLTADFCKLSLDSLKDDINPRIYISAANKLNVNPIQIEKVIHALLSIFLKTVEKNLDEKELEESLIQFNFPSKVAQLIAEAYTKNKEFLKENLEKMGIKVLEYEDLNWRFDVLTKTRSLNEVVEPIITMQLKLKDEGALTVQEYHVQVDPNTLIHMTESMEEALQQARSHHVRNFKKQKKSS